jgi:hypothetical protein
MFVNHVVPAAETRRGRSPQPLEQRSPRESRQAVGSGSVLVPRLSSPYSGQPQPLLFDPRQIADLNKYSGLTAFLIHASWNFLTALTF